MGESLNQPIRVQDDGPMGCKLLLYEKNSLTCQGLTVPYE